MSFGINYKDTENSDIIPEGEYEVFIKSASETTTKQGKRYINVTFVVRDDVEQKCKNKYIWHQIWKKREPNQADLACGGYNNQQIQILSKAVEFENGRQFESIEDWCSQLEGRVAKVTVRHEKFNGYVNAKVQKIEKTKYPGFEIYDVDDEDLPF